MKQAFVGATIFPVASKPIQNGTIVIEDGIIIDVGNDIDISGIMFIKKLTLSSRITSNLFTAGNKK